MNRKRNRLTAEEVMMEFGHRSSNETGNGSLLADRAPQEKAACEELPLPERSTWTLPIGNSPRIAIKTEGRILLIDAGEVIAVEAKGRYVCYCKFQVHTCCESLSRPWRKSSICTDLCEFIDLFW